MTAKGVLDVEVSAVDRTPTPSEMLLTEIPILRSAFHRPFACALLVLLAGVPPPSARSTKPYGSTYAPRFGGSSSNTCGPGMARDEG